MTEQSKLNLPDGWYRLPNNGPGPGGSRRIDTPYAWGWVWVSIVDGIPTGTMSSMAAQNLGDSDASASDYDPNASGFVGKSNYSMRTFIDFKEKLEKLWGESCYDILSRTMPKSGLPKINLPDGWHRITASRNSCYVSNMEHYVVYIEDGMPTALNSMATRGGISSFYNSLKLTNRLPEKQEIEYFNKTNEFWKNTDKPDTYTWLAGIYGLKEVATQVLEPTVEGDLDVEKPLNMADGWHLLDDQIRSADGCPTYYMVYVVDGRIVACDGAGSIESGRFILQNLKTPSPAQIDFVSKINTYLAGTKENSIYSILAKRYGVRNESNTGAWVAGIFLALTAGAAAIAKSRANRIKAAQKIENAEEAKVSK